MLKKGIERSLFSIDIDFALSCSPREIYSWDFLTGKPRRILDT
jgi:hypothetical protein